MYDLSSIVIAGVLLAAILLANELGYRFGRSQRPSADSGAKSQTNAIQAAMLGLLALLLGFTFAMAAQRFDNRSQAVLNEANAIGTAYLRTQLLPEAQREPAQAMIAGYVQLRVAASELDWTQEVPRRRMRQETEQAQNALWALALKAAMVDPRPVTAGLFIQSLNDMIDAYGERLAALAKHVPELVLMLLFAVFVIAGTVLGYSGGLEGGRALLATVSMSLLIVLVIFMIIDLDRPRRGWIEVSQDSMIELARSVGPTTRAQ